MGEAHIAQGQEGRTDIRTVRERTAAAVHNKIGGARERFGPVFQIVETLRGRASAVEGRAGNVRAFVERVEADADNCGFGVTGSGGELFCEVGRLDGLRGGPGVNGIIGASVIQMERPGGNESYDCDRGEKEED